MKQNLINVMLGAILLFLLGFLGYSQKPRDIAGENLKAISGSELPIIWGDAGARLVGAGVIDPEKWERLYRGRGRLKEDYEKYLGNDTGKLVIDEENADIVLNLLWALGLSNKNPILEEGPMRQYGDTERFASTAGWTLARGHAMTHYSRHAFITLDAEAQAKVERVSKGIYRPCCGNSTYFPDCNHGMAMLGLLELMASQGVSEEEMYRAALAVNSYWFPDTYRTIAGYLEARGASLDAVNPRVILGKDFSSAQGFARILSEIKPPEPADGGSCGV